MTKKITLLKIDVYVDSDKYPLKYKNSEFTFIPDSTCKILSDECDKQLEYLLKYKNFTVSYCYCWGGVGCGSNSMTEYKNDENLEFTYNTHFDDSLFDCYIEVSNEFNNDKELLTIVENIQQNLTNLWNDKLFGEVLNKISQLQNN